MNSSQLYCIRQTASIMCTDVILISQGRSCVPSNLVFCLGGCFFGRGTSQVDNALPSLSMSPKALSSRHNMPASCHTSGKRIFPFKKPPGGFGLIDIVAQFVKAVAAFLDAVFVSMVATFSLETSVTGAYTILNPPDNFCG